MRGVSRQVGEERLAFLVALPDPPDRLVEEDVGAVALDWLEFVVESIPVVEIVVVPCVGRRANVA